MYEMKAYKQPHKPRINSCERVYYCQQICIKELMYNVCFLFLLQVLEEAFADYETKHGVTQPPPPDSSSSSADEVIF